MIPSQHLFFISGWAHSSDVLHGLASHFISSFETHCLSPVELLKLSTASAEGTSGSNYARSLSRLVNQQERPCSIIAWSMGALIALEAIAYFKLPVKSLVIINGTAKFCSSEDYPYGVPEKNVRAMKVGMVKNVERTLMQFFQDGNGAETSNTEMIHERIKTALSFGIETLLDGLTYLQETDLRERMPSITVPVLLIHGEEDRIIPLSAAQYLHEQLPESTLHSVPNAGHSSCVDNPELVRSIIFDFLTKGTTSV